MDDKKVKDIAVNVLYVITLTWAVMMLIMPVWLISLMMRSIFGC